MKKCKTLSESARRAQEAIRALKAPPPPVKLPDPPRLFHRQAPLQSLKVGDLFVIPGPYGETAGRVERLNESEVTVCLTKRHGQPSTERQGWSAMTMVRKVEVVNAKGKSKD